MTALRDRSRSAALRTGAMASKSRLRCCASARARSGTEPVAEMGP